MNKINNFSVFNSHFSILFSLFFILSLIFFVAPVNDAAAEEENEFKWSFGPTFGVHFPSLEILNEGEFKSPILTGVSPLYDDPEEEGVDTNFIIRNPLPRLGIGFTYGFEFQWYISEKHTFLVGGTSWEKMSEATTQVIFPFQGLLREDTISQRRGKLSYTQVYLGWNYNFLSKPRKYRLYTKFSLHEVFDVDYKEDLVFTFTDEFGETFKRIIIIESEASGAFMTHFGLGGEFFLLKWLSIGLESGFFVGSIVNLKLDSIKNDFLFTDADIRNFPTSTDVSNNVIYRSEDDTSWEPFKLGFDGWVALFRIKIYF